MRASCFVIVVLTCVLRLSRGFLNVDEEVQEQCVHSCKSQNCTDVTHFDDNYVCDIQCEEGCKLWKSALNSSCQTVCNSTNGATLELYCIIGCNDAVTRYYTELRNRLGTPPPPALVADSLTATSLRLEWNFPEAKEAGLRYFLQWKYEEHVEAWQYCRNQSWGPQDTVFVDNLQPYTKYRFRVALILSNLTDPIVSPPSVVISTRPAGVPASPPNNVRAVPVDSTRISVSWEPGPFPHGPLLSYELTITDNHQYSALKDLPSENPNFYIFKTLTPNSKYNISISMTNAQGRGPPANVTVSTPMVPTAKNSEKPVLILGAQHVVIEQGTDMLDEPVILYSTENFITGLAIHVTKHLLFVSDSERYIHCIHLHKTRNHTTNTVILSPAQMNFIPLDLSMDWLNEELYILGEVIHQPKAWQITRCNLNGRGLTVAVAGLRIKPHHIEVDPYNGYLFWVTKTGLYKLDLSDISNGIKHEVQPRQILAESNLGAFTVDHTNFRLLVSNQNKHTINSVSFNGKEVHNMRQNITKSRLQKVVSIATANEKFYWTDGNEVLYEEYHASKVYFHNSYSSKISKSYIKVLVNLTSSQPIPVPVNPPTSVQAIFGTNRARTTWQMPNLLGEQGKGAWQNWSYQISIKDLTTNNSYLIRDINSTSYTIPDLNENTEYIIKTSAYTSYGEGPWSTEFIGRTLKQNSDEKHVVILWSAVEGLLKSDASGENVEIVVPKTSMGNYHFNDISWYMDQLFLVTNTSQVYWYNMTSHKHGILLDIDSVGSIAIDWLGKKLYWSNPKKQLIIRGNLNGSLQEPLPILTLAKELNVDSINGYLYWSTGHAVECALLNGSTDRIVYHESQLFSGKQVMGLTLDMDHQTVYWIVRGSDESNLFKAPMAGYANVKPTAVKVSGLQKPNMLGPLCYFNNRLIWLQDDKSAVISDLKGRYAARISSKSLLGLNMMLVMDSSLHVIPKAGINVLPEMIDKTSVKVIGTWQSFNITWKPVENVNYGTVYYEIKSDTIFRNGSAFVTTSPSTRYWNSIPPYTKIHISLRAYTYWGTSPQIRVWIYSPPSTPSAPRNPRTYVIYQHHYSSKDQINITYRWNAPELTNGVLEGYKVFWWYYQGRKKNTDSVTIDASDKEYIISNVMSNTIYYFQVQAFTEIGDGNMSKVIQTNTSVESPIPTLLIASSDAIYFQDTDTNQNYSLIHGISTPIEIVYSIKERKVFWINDMQELRVFNLATHNRSKLYDFNGKVVSVTMDWLERSLYYVQLDEQQGSLLYKVDLNKVEKGYSSPMLVFRTPFEINKIEISPFARKLYWIETDQIKKLNRLMQANTDGSNITTFFWDHSREKSDNNDCNCPEYPLIEKSFTIDHSYAAQIPSIIFTDLTSKSVLSADRNGCHCQTVISNKILSESLPIQNLKSDFETTYFTNKSRGLLYSYKGDSNELEVMQIAAEDILIYGSHVQPYPPTECLHPVVDKNLVIGLKNKTSNSLVLTMPEYYMNPKCENMTIATVEYVVFYMPYNDEKDLKCDEICPKEVTFEKVIEIKNLRPHSKYVFSLALNNYYSRYNENRSYIGNSVVFQTAAGAPSPPRNVEVIVLNPKLVQVKWQPPIELNGDFVNYEIHWRTEGFTNGIIKGEQSYMKNELPGNAFYSTYLHKLSPNEAYTIWVCAKGQNNETWSKSKEIKVKIFPEPDNLTLVSASAFALFLQWNISSYIEACIVQYALLTSNEWHELNYVQNNRTSILIGVEGLKPKNQYKFRLLLKYPNYNEMYQWPMDSKFTFETTGDRPSPPGIPKIQPMKDYEYQIWWDPSKDNGSPIEMYMLEAMKIPNYRSKRSTNRTAWDNNAPSINNLEWESIYNGTETLYKSTDLYDEYRYSFRVSALNSYGWSDLSPESLEYDPLGGTQIIEKQNLKYLIISVSVPSLLIFAICIGIVSRKICSMNSKKKQHVLDSPKGPDVELATLRELPRRGNFIHNTNVLYISTQATPEELTLLPHIRRDRITLMKFLGSGAFGEVFEGVAKGLVNGEDTKVAVKTLRKGASEQEKNEFLQEAQLMSHFKHEHILQLLGVCLDNDPHFIIMELMEGGDLLTYLRSSRKSGVDMPYLNLLDLLKMCVDVAKGCRYLEEMHFVHRDLACRNCLVSSTDPTSRIVKIGDFGLARDIYKNDYYRKEGEGLLPVRWMAPESLVDGVFTCQSDVWAFGVLLWEIMTLGQQPYPARNNLEVLHYVRRGGRLGKPMDCPEELYSLMLECWSYEPETRPTFKFCLEALLKSHIQTINSPMTGAHVGQYISTVPQPLLDGISNQAYFQDENHNNSGASWKSGSDDDSSRERLPFIPRTSAIPQYLELVYDSDSLVENDGYEVPRTALEKYEIETEPDVCRKTNDDVANIENLHLNIGYTNMNPEMSSKAAEKTN